MRRPVKVNPGTNLYFAQIYDDYGLTFKVGSGKVADRIEELNRYRRLTLKQTSRQHRLTYMALVVLLESSGRKAPLGVSTSDCGGDTPNNTRK